MPSSLLSSSQVTLSFSAAEFAQLEAFATLNGLSVGAFIQKAALETAQISAPAAKTPVSEPSWWDETSTQTSENQPESAPEPELFDVAAPLANSQAETATKPRAEKIRDTESPAKRGVAGEPSKLAKGQGLVWEIRRALSEERVHGLGWTREHLAFVLKLSVVGVRKMERLGTTPIKSLEARRALLKLAQTLENPSPTISAYIAAEVAAMSEI